jgi:hypothetical protein
MQELGPNQTRLVEALEAGAYRQGNGWLCHKNGDDIGKSYCCLGVGMELFFGNGHDNGPGKPMTWPSDALFNAVEKYYATAMLVETLKLRGSHGDTIDADEDRSLASLNDEGKPFAEIAALIRSDPSVYFTEPA